MTDLPAVVPNTTPSRSRSAGTWRQPPIPAGDVTRIRAASHLARTVFPGELGELVARELVAWCEVGQQFGGHGRMLAVAQDLEARYRALTAERTYG